MERSPILRFSVTFLRILFGTVFIFSGIAKAVDPMGLAYKNQEYFHALQEFFNSSNVGSFDAWALPLGILLFSLEFIIGFCLFVGSSPRIMTKLGLAFMLFFTPLTLYLALYNPVSDCGCFGDALKITNNETFAKNIILLLIAIVIMRFYRHTRSASKVVYIPPLLAILFVGSVAIYSLVFLPMMDFRPYKIGTNILESMTAPEGAPVDKYETTFIYAKNGEQKEFTVNNLPKLEEGWTFVDQKSILLEKGYEPPIHDFVIDNAEQGEITDLITEGKGYSFLVLSQKMQNANAWTLERMNELYAFAKTNNIPYIFASASGEETVNAIVQKLNLKFEVNSMDETTIKTIIRSNPGVLLIKDGVIINKWAYYSFPKDWNDALHETPSPQVKKWIMLVILLILIISCSLLAIKYPNTTVISRKNY